MSQLEITKSKKGPENARENGPNRKMLLNRHPAVPLRGRTRVDCVTTLEAVAPSQRKVTRCHACSLACLSHITNLLVMDKGRGKNLARFDEYSCH